MAEAKLCPQYFACVLAAIIAFPTGIALGWTSPVEDDLLNGKYGFRVSKSEYSWVAASLPLGGLMSTIPSGLLVDFTGRQWVLLVAVIPQMVGWLLIRLAQNIWYIYAGRILLGMVCGTLFVAIPTYLGEITQRSIRANMIMLFNVFLYGGVLFIYIFGAIMDPMSLLILGLVMPMKLSVCPMFLMESPVFLTQNNKESDAKNALKKLRGSQYDMNKEMVTIRDELDIWTKDRQSFIQKLCTRTCQRALYVGCGLMCFQALCGPMMFYSNDIFDRIESGFHRHSEIIIVGAVQFLSMIIQSLIIERLGRRIFLLVSATIIAVCNVILGSYFLCLSKAQSWTYDCSWLQLVVICISSVGFSLGLGSIPWIMSAEIFPPDIKGTASSIPLAVFWTFLLIATKVSVNIDVLSEIYILFFCVAITAVFAIVFVYYLVPEPRGKSVFQIIENLNG